MSRAPAISLFTMEEAAEQLRVSRRWLQDFIQGKDIPVTRSGRRKLFDGRAIELMVAHLPGPKRTAKTIRKEVETINRRHNLIEGIEAEKRARQGVVYFIRSGDFVKIGFTTNLEMRVQALQTGSPTPLEVLHAGPGTERDELEMHRRFADLRMAREWFRLEGDLAEFIKRRKQ